jgi:hypothetical protein
LKDLLIITNNISNPNWLSGFSSGEGNFDIRINKSKTCKTGFRIFLRFRIYQHERDIKLMEYLIKYLGVGKLVKNTVNSVLNISIYKISDIIKVIIPYFEKNPLLGVKQLDFLDWCTIAKLIFNKQHITPEGLKKYVR